MNIKLIALAISALTFIAMASYIYILRADIKGLKTDIAGLEKYLEESEAEVAQCVSDKALSERVSNDYQTSLTSLRRQLNSLRNDPKCVPTEPTPAPDGRSGAAAGTKLSSGNGLRAGYLFDFAGRAEETRLRLIGCQSFIDALYLSRVNE